MTRDADGRLRPLQPAASQALDAPSVPLTVPEETPAPPAPEADTETLIAQLRQASAAGGDGASFEAVVAVAMARLGFEVTPIGGSGDTDLVVRGRRGRTPVVLVVDAKSRGSGVVGDGDVNWYALGDHRGRNGAASAVVVGPAFAEGNVRTHAQQAGVRLLGEVTGNVHWLRGGVGYLGGHGASAYERYVGAVTEVLAEDSQHADR